MQPLKQTIWGLNVSVRNWRSEKIFCSDFKATWGETKQVSWGQESSEDTEEIIWMCNAARCCFPSSEVMWGKAARYSIAMATFPTLCSHLATAASHNSWTDLMWQYLSWRDSDEIVHKFNFITSFFFFYLHFLKKSFLFEL